MIEIWRGSEGNHWWSGNQMPEPVKAIKKPIVIEARKMPCDFTVQTKEGKMKGKTGDWLLTGVHGEMYPCDADIFAATYDIQDAKEME